MKYTEMNQEQLQRELQELQEEYAEIQTQKLKLDMSRGKPEASQADLSLEMLQGFSNREDLFSEEGLDCANYGVLDGLPEAKRFVADVMDCDPKQVSIWENSSLMIMYSLISMGYIKGVLGEEPWCRQEGLKFLCPVPGYDRHFAITEHFGFEMISIPMNENGPDMDLVEQYVRDPAVKGIWCVPLYSNPGGVCYSDETVRRMASLKPAAPDFRIYWDNAYCVHHLYPDHPAVLLDILKECRKNGNENMVYELFSTSKITIAGAGMAALITSEENLADIRKQASVMTVGFEKLNQLRHVRFLKDKKTLEAHMAKHAAILRPKFEAVLDTLEKELGGLGIACWTKPRGGYFISLDTLEGCARRVVELCREAGVVLTPAGSTYPYKRDPKDTNIRIAPTYPSPENLMKACRVLTVCVRLASVEKLLK